MDTHFYHGAVLKLTREDTAETIEKNFELMRGCGLDTVVIWPACFWWEEKREGYPFNTGREVLTLAEKHGLKIIMELAGQLTTMEYIPDFLMKPEYLPTRPSGEMIKDQSAYGYLNYFHPEVKALIAKHFREAALAYKDYPALLGYDVFNETMFSSHDEYTLADFREWLKDKYGTIENLNRVWERTYASFDSIGRESWKWMSVMPDADFGIWHKEAIPRFMKGWCDAIREVDREHMLIADNIHSQVAPGAMYDRPHGDFEIKTAVDEIGMSFYPKQQTSYMSPATRWEVFDSYACAARREGFFISEMQTHIQALFNPGTCVLPEELKLWCHEAYAAGAKGLIYWMWRPFTKGLQTLGRGIVNYRTVPTERYGLVKEMSEELFGKYGVITPVRSKVGVLYHELSDDLSRKYACYNTVDSDIYLRSVFGAYKAFMDIGVRADIITLDELSGYECVVITNACAMSRADCDRIAEFVKGGGRVILDGKVAVVDEESMQYEYIPGGGLHELVGEIYFETDNRYSSFELDGAKYNFFYGRDRVELTGAQVLASFPDGLPAFVKKACGKGEAYTFNLHLFYSYAKGEGNSAALIAKRLADELSLRQLECDAPLSVRLAKSGDKTLVFAFNYTKDGINDATVTVDGTTIKVSVPENGVSVKEI